MRKILVIFALLFTVPIFAQDVVMLDAYELAVRLEDEWSDWVECSIPVKMDFNVGKVTIYSEEVQIYTLLKQVDGPKDHYGDSVYYKVRDQDGDIGIFTFRRQRNNIRQIYLDFGDVGWVYNVSIR